MSPRRIGGWPGQAPQPQQRGSQHRDLAACVFDLSDGPVRIAVTPGAAYTSLTFYAPKPHSRPQTSSDAATGATR